MIRRVLGRTGLSVSEVAFGGVEIGMPYGIGDKGNHHMPDEELAVKLLRTAVALGINFFDTARLYGESERLMGIAFAGIREQVVLATKCQHFKDEHGNIPVYDELEKIVHHSLKQSLEALQTDYVDIFMVHYADIDILQNKDVVRIFSDLKLKGKVKNIGISVYKAEESLFAVESGVWDVIQLPFNLMDQSHSICFRKAQEKGIGIIVRSVLMRGLLTDRIFNMNGALLEVSSHIEKYRDIANRTFNSFPEYATKFVLKHKEVSSVLVGIDKEDYLLASIDNLQGETLSEDLFGLSRELAYPYPEFLNLAEWDRKGWL